MKHLPIILLYFCLYVGLPISLTLATLGYFFEPYQPLLYVSFWCVCGCVVVVVFSYLLDCKINKDA